MKSICFELFISAFWGSKKMQMILFEFSWERCSIHFFLKYGSRIIQDPIETRITMAITDANCFPKDPFINVPEKEAKKVITKVMIAIQTLMGVLIFIPPIL